MPKLFNRFKLHQSDKKKKKASQTESNAAPKPIRDIRKKPKPSQKPSSSAIASPQTSKRPEIAAPTASASSSNLSLSTYTTALAYDAANVSDDSLPSPVSANYSSQPTSPSTIKSPSTLPSTVHGHGEGDEEQRFEANIARLRLLVTFYGIIAGSTKYNLSHDLTDIVTSLSDSEALDLLNSVVSSTTSLELQSVPEIVDLMKPYAKLHSSQGGRMLYFDQPSQSNRSSKRYSKHSVGSN